MQANQQDRLYKTTLALAGMVQATSLIRELAQTGKMNEAAFHASIYSIFQTNPENIPDVFGNIASLRLGLEKLIQTFSIQGRTNRPTMRYIVSLLYLQKKLSRSPKLLNEVIQRINKTKKQADYFHLTHPTVIANLADTYVATTSLFKFRLIIWGTQRSLSVNENMDKIRALLLAGLRSAVLWRQLGGSRLHLLFSRAKIKTMAEKILADIH